MASFKSARDLLLVGVQKGLLDEEKPIIQTIFKNKLNAIETIINADFAQSLWTANRGRAISYA